MLKVAVWKPTPKRLRFPSQKLGTAESVAAAFSVAPSPWAVGSLVCTTLSSAQLEGVGPYEWGLPVELEHILDHLFVHSITGVQNGEPAWHAVQADLRLFGRIDLVVADGCAQ